MNSMPEVSIILPTYNGAKFIERALTSITAQTFEDFELIVVDDCSTDETNSILQKYESRDSRLRVIRNSNNLRLPASLNIGHKRAKGKFITWTSDDNILKPEFLFELVNKLKEKKVDIIFSDFEIINENDEFIRFFKAGPVEILPFCNPIGASFLYKKEVFEYLEYNETLHGIEDYDFWMRAVLKFKFSHSTNPVYKYRVHSNSLTATIAADIQQNLNFENNLKKVLNNLKFCSLETKEVLFRFQRLASWDWDFYFENRIKLESDLRNWLQLFPNENSLKKNYLKLLRQNILRKSTKKEVRRLFYNKPEVFLNLDFSNKTSLILLIRLFKKKFMI